MKKYTSIMEYLNKNVDRLYLKVVYDLREKHVSETTTKQMNGSYSFGTRAWHKGSIRIDILKKKKNKCVGWIRYEYRPLMNSTEIRIGEMKSTNYEFATLLSFFPEFKLPEMKVVKEKDEYHYNHQSDGHYRLCDHWD